MKAILFSSLLLIFCIVEISFAQKSGTDQQQVAEKFLKHLLEGQSEQCWALIDKQKNPGSTKEQFLKSFAQLRSDLLNVDGFKLQLVGEKYYQKQTCRFYSFLAVRSRLHSVKPFNIDVMFVPGDSLIAGIQPKQMMKPVAATSEGNETEIVQEFMAEIEGVSYRIVGINLVHFGPEEALLALQVAYKVPFTRPDLAKWANQEGIKFARYLYKSPYLAQAQSKALEMNRKLLDKIGVSFLDATGQGFNTMILPSEYQ